MKADAPALSCQQFVELVTKYLEAVLPGDARAACDAHLAGCTACSTYLTQMRQTILMLGKLIDESVDLSSRDELIRRFRTWKDSSP